MHYVSKGEHERAPWMTLPDAIKHVRRHEGCSHNSARKQLSDALADREIRVKWADEDVERTRALAYSLLTVPPMPLSDEDSGEAKEPEVPAEAKANAIDQARLGEFQAKWEPQRAELETRGYLDRTIEAIAEIAYRKTEIAYKKGITSALAVAIYQIEHPPPPVLGADVFGPPAIDRAPILKVPAFWREMLARGGKVFDPTRDRWRVPLLDREHVLKLWPKEKTAKPPSVQRAAEPSTNAPAGKRKRGPKADKRDQIVSRMWADYASNPTALDEEKEETLRTKYQASRDTVRKARNIALQRRSESPDK